MRDYGGNAASSGTTGLRIAERPKNSATNFTVVDMPQHNATGDASSSFIGSKAASAKRMEQVRPHAAEAFSKVTSNPSLGSTTTFSKNLAQRQELINNYLLGNVIAAGPRYRAKHPVQVTVKSRGGSRRHSPSKGASVGATVDLSGRWATVENSTMFSPVVYGKPRLQKSNPSNQAKIAISRYQKASSAAYSTRQEQILQSYMIHRRTK